MVFVETKIEGTFLIEPTRLEDERGFFARTYCEQEFSRRGLRTQWVQCSASFNKKKGTLRGMHYQAEPHPEAKLVRCTAGALHDVVLDLRPRSPTFKQWIEATLTADNHRMVYLPEGCAHGFQTLADNTEVYYQISEYYDASLSRGVRW